MARPTLPRCSTGQGARYSVALLIALLLSACTSNPGQPWQSTHGLGHPLTGKIWGVGAERFVTPEAMVTSLVRADLVLLGEKHDNAGAALPLSLKTPPTSTGFRPGWSAAWQRRGGGRPSPSRC